MEGLLLLLDGWLVVLNDNDFGLLDEEIFIDGIIFINFVLVLVVLGIVDFLILSN